MNDYLNVIRNHYVDFTGRARRREYWMFVLFNCIISLVLGLIDRLFFGRGGDGEPRLYLSGLYSLAVFLPSLAVLVRRLHDTGRSGWWVLLSLIPVIGSLVLLIFAVQDSQPGSNKWGPNPKEDHFSPVTVSSNNW